MSPEMGDGRMNETAEAFVLEKTVVSFEFVGKTAPLLGLAIMLRSIGLLEATLPEISDLLTRLNPM